MDIFERYNLTPKKALKAAGVVLAGLVVLAAVISLAAPSVRNAGSGLTYQLGLAPSSADMAMKSEAYAEMAYDGAVGLSVRNVEAVPAIGLPSPIDPTPVPGEDAEEYEVTSYSASIETRNAERDCAVLLGLKAREDVIFESASEHDRGCHVSFKIRRQSAPEILEIISGMDPKDLNESTYTIKRLVEDYTSELEILEGRLEAINKTLADAVAAYDDITRVASQTRDAEALAKIIDSKIQIIERLTNQRISVSAQMERLGRAKAEQMDRLAYTAWSVSVYENRFVDGEQIRDSWKAAVQNFVRTANGIVQGITVGLVALLLLAVQWAIYLLILVLMAKYGWQALVRIWKA